MKIRPMGAELLHEDTIKLTVTFSNDAKALKYVQEFGHGLRLF